MEILIVALLAGAAGLAVWLGRSTEQRHAPRPLPPPQPDASTVDAWTRQARATLRAAEHLVVLQQNRRYIPGSALQAWRSEHLPDDPPLSAAAQRHLSSELRARYHKAIHRIEAAEQRRQEHNEGFVHHQLRSMGTWFDTALARPLTEAQRRAVITNEDNNLIVAGAGTGKTTTIEARALYLVQQQLAQPGDILILSFNRSVAEEIRERLHARDLPVDVETFHSLGLKILGEVEGRKPAISPLAESDVERKVFLHNQLMALVREKGFLFQLTLWLVDAQAQSIVIEECRTPEERILRERGLGRVTLSGKRLRSLSEVLVANWLSLNGIAWEHERRYPHAPPNPKKRDYTPDFYLSEADVWLEVWAADRSGETSETIDASAYRDSMQWKRDLHRQHQTRLIEVFQDDIWSDSLSGVLQEKMKAAAIRTRLLSEAERQALLDSGKTPIRRLISLLDRFLQLYRGGSWSMAAIQERQPGIRDRLFLKIFLPLHDRYVDHLKQEQRIDFHDMLLRASRHLHKGRHTARYSHIMVDEFQDISHTRLAMLEGVRTCTPGSRLFLVGDDWQSIYQFAGSDIALFTKAPSLFAYCARTDLDQTFRLTPAIQRVSSQFVMRNPNQLQKRVRPRPGAARNVGLCIYRHTGNVRGTIHRFTRDLKTALPQGGHVFVLGRYRRTLNQALLADVRQQLGERFEVTASTVHRAKGLEADHVLLLDVDGGTHGFPSRQEDDPVLRLVTHSRTRFPDAEERRLFYVGLTRTRSDLSLLTDGRNPSDFIRELLSDADDEFIQLIDVGEHGTIETLLRCPRCQGASIRRKSTQKGGWFWGCVHWPDCIGTLPTCHRCGKGAMQPTDPHHSTCSACSSTAPHCPLCGGVLKLKEGRNGPFWGCSQYARSGCRFTRSA